MKRTVLLLVLAALSLHAQDGGMVLRTLVGYNAQKNSLALTEEQRKEVERLGQEGQRLGFTGQFGEALRRFYHGTAIMNGAAWTPPVELAASLQLKLDSALPEHGRPLTVSLHPLFPVERAAGEKVLVTVALVPAGPAGTPQGEGRVLASRAALDGSKLPWSLAVTLPSNDTGRYFLEARLAPAEGAPDLKARAAFLKRLPVAIDSLAENAARLRTRLAATKSTSTELPTAQYALQLFELASRGEANPHRFDFRKEFDNAQAVLDALDKGESGFASKRGDFRKAYRSDVDKTLQPYRLFVPAAYDPAKKTPLVVALHGMGGDENSIFDVYSNGAIKKEGERLGWLIVAPKGRDSASMYRGSAEKDVLDVIAEVERDYNIDPTAST
ncbi:MAG: hypothetical protein SFV54_16220 [Bryobacteraceae bacterium]|nr:hypothetical protein [Bryobacteraceae bacterium]